MSTQSQPQTAQHGHPFFYEQTRTEEQLHSDKNHDYAAGGDPLGNFKRVAKILSLYPGLDPSDPAVVALIYALKQLDAVLWGLAKKIEHKVEGFHPRLQDISVYAKLVRCLLRDALPRRTAAQAPSLPTSSPSFPPRGAGVPPSKSRYYKVYDYERYCPECKFENRTSGPFCDGCGATMPIANVVLPEAR